MSARAQWQSAPGYPLSAASRASQGCAAKGGREGGCWGREGQPEGGAWPEKGLAPRRVSGPGRVLPRRRPIDRCRPLVSCGQYE